MYERLVELMNERKITPYRLSKATGVTQATLSRWKNGKTSPSIETLQTLADYFSVSVDYLTGNVNNPFFYLDNERILKEINHRGIDEIYNKQNNIQDNKLMTNRYHVDLDKIHRIPILGRVAAGLPLYADEHIIGYTYTERNGGAEYFGLLVDGDSMNATAILDGSVVIVRKQEIVDNGQIAVVLVDGEEATVKRYHRQGNTVTLMPQSTNPAHKLQVYNLRETDISILGKVVEVKNDIE